jgi:hypothetical protein
MSDGMTKQETEPCGKCGGTARVAPDSARYGGMRTQGASMDNKIDCPVYHATGRVPVKKESSA